MDTANYTFEVITGPEGPCLAVGDAADPVLRTRIAGPKPWGGGRTIRRFTVKRERLLDALGVKPETLSEGPKARSTDPPTSKTAALRNKPRAGTQRDRLLSAVASTARHGMTAEEAALRTGIRLNSASTRMSELLRGGHVMESPDTRKTSGGEQAVVYIATAHSRVMQDDLVRGEELAAAHGWD